MNLGEYGNPINALKAKDYESVFVLAHPERVPLHNLYEALWFFKTGFPRYIKMLIIDFLLLTDLRRVDTKIIDFIYKSMLFILGSYVLSPENKNLYTTKTFYLKGINIIQSKK